MYGKVIVDITHEKLDKVFEYHIPTEWEGKFLLLVITSGKQIIYI